MINFGQDSGIAAKILTEHLPNTCLLQRYRHINLLRFIVFLDVTPTHLLYASVNNQPVNQPTLHSKVTLEKLTAIQLLKGVHAF